jgi:hypothetical protein
MVIERRPTVPAFGSVKAGTLVAIILHWVTATQVFATLDWLEERDYDSPVDRRLCDANPCLAIAGNT